GDGAITAPGLPDRADALVLATPPGVTASLIEGLVPEAPGLLREIPSAPIAVVWLGFRSKRIGINLDAYGFLVARGEGPTVLGCQYESTVFPGRAPEGGVLLRVILGGTFDPGAIGETDDATIARACNDLGTIAGLDRSPDFGAVLR